MTQHLDQYGVGIEAKMYGDLTELYDTGLRCIMSALTSVALVRLHARPAQQVVFSSLTVVVATRGTVESVIIIYQSTYLSFERQ